MSVVMEVSDQQIAELYHHRWYPAAAGHLHGPTLWATWDGHKTVHVALQPGVQRPADDIMQAEPELAAFVTGIELPSGAEILANGVRAFSRWIAAGLPVVSEAERAERAAICGGCPLWDARARAGLGVCRHKRCGCTQLKWWLATERCPAGNWPDRPLNGA